MIPVNFTKSCPNCGCDNFLMLDDRTRLLMVKCSSCHAEMGQVVELAPEKEDLSKARRL